MGHDETAGVGGAHPHSIGAGGNERPARSFAPVDLHRFAGDETRLQAAIERVRETTGIGEDPVSGAQRALGRFD